MQKGHAWRTRKCEDVFLFFLSDAEKGNSCTEKVILLSPLFLPPTLQVTCCIFFNPASMRFRNDPPQSIVIGDCKAKKAHKGIINKPSDSYISTEVNCT